MTHEEKLIHNAVHAELKEFEEFKALVKRMRDAQIEKDESDQGYRTMPHICILEKKDKLESEVDEYLKKMEEERK